MLVPWLKESLPIIVLISIILGLLVTLLARLIALSILSTLVPSLTKSVCQPQASKRFRMFSLFDLVISPSWVMSLESYNTIRLPRLYWPAREAASRDSPVSKSPSLTKQ